MGTIISANLGPAFPIDTQQKQKSTIPRIKGALESQ